ncbi:Aldose-1-epimerase family protein, partial [human gut metagenome]
MINGELIDLVAGPYEARIATSGATLVHLRREGRDVVVPFDAERTLPAAWQGK